MHNKEAQTINEVFESRDFRGLLDKASKPTRSYTRKEGAEIYKPERARTKLKVWFTDGNAKSFYSYDNRKKPDGSVFHDEWTGLKKLIQLLLKFEGKYKCAMIFATADEDPLTGTAHYDVQVLKYTKTRKWENELIGFHKDGYMMIRSQA